MVGGAALEGEEAVVAVLDETGVSGTNSISGINPLLLMVANEGPVGEEMAFASVDEEEGGDVKGDGEEDSSGTRSPDLMA